MPLHFLKLKLNQFVTNTSAAAMAAAKSAMR